MTNSRLIGGPFRNLKSYGELPEYAKINENVGLPGEEDDDEDIIEFNDDAESSSDDEIDNVSFYTIP